MSLEAGVLKVSGGPNAVSREEVSMATLEAGTTPRAATNRHSHTEWNQWRYLPKRILIWEMIMKPLGREGGEGARICSDSQEGKNWSAAISKQSYNATQR